MLTLFVLAIVCFPGLLLALITFLVPRELMKLYLSWNAIIFLLWYAYTIQIPSFSNKLFSGFDEEILWANTLISGIAILIRILFIYTFSENPNSSIQDLLDNEFKDLYRVVKLFTLIIYISILVYFVYLFFRQ